MNDITFVTSHSTLNLQTFPLSIQSTADKCIIKSLNFAFIVDIIVLQMHY